MPNIFDISMFMPHGHCYLWQPGLLWLHVISNSIVTFAYLSIPAALLVLLRNRRDIEFQWIYVLFAAFILLCGSTHLMDIVTVWIPTYWLDGGLRALTAGVSVFTAIELWRLLPRAAALPSTKQLAQINQDLKQQIEVRIRSEQKLHDLHLNLEKIVDDRTKELEAANAALKAEIEERKVTEEKLREQREWFGATLSSVGDGVIATNARGQIEFINPVAQSMTGWQESHAIGKQLSDIFDIRNDETGEKIEVPHFIVPDDGAVVGLANNTILYSRNGGEFYIEITLAPIRASEEKLVGQLLIFHDIAEHRKSKVLESRLAALVESSTDAIIGTDLAGTITSWNAGAKGTFGYTVDEVRGKPISILSPQEQEGDLTTVLSNIRAGKKVEAYDTERIRKDGRRIFVSLSISPIIDQRGLVIGSSEVVRDISDKKVVEQHRKEYERKIENANRELMRSNEDLEQFSYLASHDLQEPLRKLSSFSQLLAEEYSVKLDGDALEYLGFISDGAMRMQRLIDDLLELSRAGATDQRKKHISLEPILTEVLNNLELQISEQGATITVEGLPTIHADSSDMIRLFQNLIVNALKYRSEDPPVVSISCKRELSDWVFCVRDNGIGIDPKYLENIFIIFKRLHGHKKYPGTGVGLAICKKIVERSGGRIWAESSGHGGTSFFFTWPIKDRD